MNANQRRNRRFPNYTALPVQEILVELWMQTGEYILPMQSTMKGLTCIRYEKLVLGNSTALCRLQVRLSDVQT